MGYGAALVLPMLRGKELAMSMQQTAKQRVLERHPKAAAVYVGLSLKIVIKRRSYSDEISGHFSRERDAWADAARKL